MPIRDIKIKTRAKRLGIEFDIINSVILGQIFILSCPNRKSFTQSANYTAFESPTIKKTKKNFHLSIIFYFLGFILDLNHLLQWLEQFYSLLISKFKYSLNIKINYFLLIFFINYFFIK